MIEFKNVCKKYDDNIVIKNVNLEIKEGEFFVIVGPSGAGKTTILKMINRLIDVSSGDILINKESVYDKELIPLRKSIGYVLQNIALFPHMTVRENIALVLSHVKKKDRVKIIEDLLGLVKLSYDKYKNNYPNELSGGEAQRVGIVRAIATNPKILLMDEPFSALDPISKNNLQELVKEIYKKHNMTVVFVTHDMKEALKLGTRLCIMNGGDIIQVDTPQNIMNNPKNKFVANFFRQEN